MSYSRRGRGWGEDFRSYLCVSEYQDILFSGHKVTFRDKCPTDYSKEFQGMVEMLDNIHSS